MKNIESFDIDQFKQKIDSFLQEKGSMEDGHASQRVVDLIEQIMKEEN